MCRTGSSLALALVGILAGCGRIEGSPVDAIATPGPGSAGQGTGGQASASGAGGAGGQVSSGGQGGSGGAGSGGAAGSGAKAGVGGAAGASTAGASGLAGTGGGGAGGAGKGGDPVDSWKTTVDLENPNGAGTYLDTFPRAIAVDQAGNVLVAGRVQGIFADGAIDTHLSVYGAVIKLDPSGKLLWSFAIPGPDVDVKDLALDAAGDPILVGSFVASIDLGQGPVAGAKQHDMFALALSSADGSPRWGRTWTGSGEEAATSVSVSPIDGDIVVMGHVQGTLDFGMGLLDGPAIVELHLDALGQTTAARSHGGVGVDCLRVRHKPDGNLIVAGSFGGTATFGLGGEPQTSPPDQKSMFLAEMTSAGASVRTTRFAGTGLTEGMGILCSLAVGPTGGIVVEGVLFDATDLGSGVHSQPGHFVAAFDDQQHWLWQRAPFSPTGGGEAMPTALAITSTGTAVVLGHVGGAYDLGGGPAEVEKLFAGFLAFYDGSGAYLNASTYPYGEFMALALAPDGTPVIAACYDYEGKDPSAMANHGWNILKNP